MPDDRSVAAALIRWFGNTGIAFPYIPEFALDRLQRHAPMTLSTRPVDPMSLYLFGGPGSNADRELVAGPVAEQFALSYAGHGINSYAWTVLLQRPGLRLLAQVLSGGAFGTRNQEAADLDELFEIVREADKTITWAHDPEIVILWSPFRDISAVGRMSPGVTFDQIERDAVREHPLQVFLRLADPSTDFAPNRGAVLAKEEPAVAIADLSWQPDHDDAGRGVDVARTDRWPHDLAEGRLTIATEGESVHEVDRPEQGEWLLVVDSGVALDFLTADEATGLTRFTVWRFRSDEDRSNWQIARGWLQIGAGPAAAEVVSNQITKTLPPHHQATLQLIANVVVAVKEWQRTTGKQANRRFLRDLVYEYWERPAFPDHGGFSHRLPWSTAARQRRVENLANGLSPNKGLQRDHVTPVKLIWQRLIDLDDVTPEHVSDILRELLEVRVLTTDEHARVEAFRRQAPGLDGPDVYERAGLDTTGFRPPDEPSAHLAPGSGRRS